MYQKPKGYCPGIFIGSVNLARIFLLIGGRVAVCFMIATLAHPKKIWQAVQPKYNYSLLEL